MKSVENISKEVFIKKYKNTNKPLVITQLTKDWPARKKWDIDYITKVAGENIVPLYDSKPSTDTKHQHAPATHMPLKSYINLLQKGEKDLRMFFYNILAEAPQLTKDFNYPDLGLKLFKKLPVLFLGGKNARVQMHFDIDMADILLCHFGGEKRIMLFPPEQTKHIYRVPFSFSSLNTINYENPDYDTYPALKNLEGRIAELNHGDVIYIPSGYWHYIMYDDISFSMALRAFPRKPKTVIKLLHNLLVVRTIDGFMRKVIGQSWNERNEKRTITNTHKHLNIK
ncbi:MAG: cupin-like domain-containing protein [Sulfurovum sp.]|nr:cupin-like domain-containing protein [Sulfurovum sp.]